MVGTAPPAERLFPAARRVSQRQATVLPAVRAQVLGDPFPIPRARGAAEHGEHKRVRALVQQQLAAIIIGRLFVEPELLAPRVAMLEGRQQIGGQQPGRGKSRPLLHQAPDRAPIGVRAASFRPKYRHHCPKA